MPPFSWPSFLGAKPYIIAEVGSNWLTKEDCLTSIDLAAQCGANAVKFQYFTHEDLYGPGVGAFPLLGDHGNPELPGEWIPELAVRCKGQAVDFLCTVFNPDKVKDVDPYVRMHKVASSECSYPALLEALKGTGKPVILSTGGHRLPEIAASLDMLGKTPVCLLYCVGSYPANNVNLFKIDALRNAYPACAVGYSDHTLDAYYYPRSAVVNHGAVVLEKHFYALASGAATPDRDHSLCPNAFGDMCTYVRANGFITPQDDRRDDEEDMRRYHRRRPTARGFYREVKP